jgi:hypothetical protein
MRSNYTFVVVCDGVILSRSALCSHERGSGDRVMTVHNICRGKYLVKTAQALQLVGVNAPPKFWFLVKVLFSYVFNASVVELF